MNPRGEDGPAEAQLTGLKALAVYGERRSLVMMALGFASGLPNLLIFDTLSAWLRDAGLSLEVIGVFSLATLAAAAADDPRVTGASSFVRAPEASEPA